MKKQRYIVEIEMSDGDFISAGWLKDLIQTDCDVEDEGRQKVTVQETSLPSNLDGDLEEEAEAYWKAQGGGSHAQWDKFRAVVKHFTNWQKEQNLKDAVEGKVIAGKDGSQYIQTICVDIKESLPNKVKLKIIKD